MVDLGQKKVELSAFFYAQELRTAKSSLNSIKKATSLLQEMASLDINQIILFFLIIGVVHIMLPPYSN